LSGLSEVPQPIAPRGPEESRTGCDHRVCNENPFRNRCLALPPDGTPGLSPRRKPFPQDAVVEHLRMGATWAEACQATGATLREFRAWLKLSYGFALVVAVVEDEMRPDDKEARKKIMARFEGVPKPKVKLDTGEALKFLDAMRGGHSRKSACKSLKIARRRLLRHLREEPAFALAVETIEWAYPQCAPKAGEPDGGDVRVNNEDEDVKIVGSNVDDVNKDAYALPPLGRPRSEITSEQAMEIVEWLRQGHGRKTVCLALDIGYRRFLRHLRDNPDFADCVRVAEATRLETCEQRLLQLVNDPGAPALQLRAAIVYLGNRDRIAAARKTREAKGEPADDDDATDDEDATCVDDSEPENASEETADSSAGSEMLSSLKLGHGRKTACLKAGWSYRKFLKIYRRDADFAERVRMVETSREESCEFRLFQLLTGAESPSIQLRAAAALMARAA
jgi:hypothetical protein